MEIPDINLAWLWLAAGLMFAVAEIFLPSFFMIFAALATVAPITCALLGLGLTAQLVAFGMTLLATILGLRPVVLKRLRTPGSIPSRSDRLMGLTGTVSMAIHPGEGPGRINVMGEDWAATSKVSLEVGQHAVVVGVDGVILTVNPSGKPP